MGKEGKIEKRPSQEEEDLEIKTSEELEEAKKEAGVTSHMEVLKRYGEMRKEDKKNKKELTEEDREGDWREAVGLIKASLEEKGELEKWGTAEEEENKLNDMVWANLWRKRFKNSGYFLELLKQTGREDLGEPFLTGMMGPAMYAAEDAYRGKEKELKTMEEVANLKKDLENIYTKKPEDRDKLNERVEELERIRTFHHEFED